MAPATLRAQLLALLEDGPHPLEQLATWLARTASSVDRELGVMQRLKLVRVRGACWEWTGATEPVGPTREPARTNGIDLPRARRRGASPALALDDLDRLLERRDEAGLLGVCQGCGRRFFRTSASTERFCSDRCREQPPPPDTVTRIINGVIFECTSVGSAPASSWPTYERDAEGE